MWRSVTSFVFITGKFRVEISARVNFQRSGLLNSVTAEVGFVLASALDLKYFNNIRDNI